MLSNPMTGLQYDQIVTLLVLVLPWLIAYHMYVAYFAELLHYI